MQCIQKSEIGVEIFLKERVAHLGCDEKRCWFNDSLIQLKYWHFFFYMMYKRKERFRCLSIAIFSAEILVKLDKIVISMAICWRAHYNK